MSEELPVSPPKRGRPFGSKNRPKARANPARANRQTVDDPTSPSPLLTRQAPHTPGRVQVLGRNGEVLSRQSTMDQTEFHVPDEIVPDGWTYQWNAINVAGEPQNYNMLNKYKNGWRPVPASRHDGLFMPLGYSGAIEIKGLRLEERPSQLTQDAMNEERRAAQKQMADQVSQLRLSGKPGGLPTGFADQGYRGTAAQIRQTYEPAPAGLRPILEVDES